jgi:cob(I)alamin adenosyltransferase
VKIYTGQGDKGKTRLFGGRMVRKDDHLVEACGTLDELNSVLGVVVSEQLNPRMKKMLFRIQSDLFLISSELAAPANNDKTKFAQRFNEQFIHDLEHFIDELQKKLPPLRNFILPGGTHPAALLHLARTVCRRAERRLTALILNKKIDPDIFIYLNRLSDLLFVSARYTNYLQGKKDIIWNNLEKK